MAVDQPKPRPKGLVKQPKYSQGQGLGDVELRADLEKYMYGNPLARLGYELYKEGKINVGTISPYNNFGTLGSYISPRLASKKMGYPTKGLLQYIPETTLSKDKEEINPLLTFIHELSHAGAEVVEAKEKNRLRNIEDEYSFEGKQNSPRQEAGFNEYGNIDYEEGAVRAGDKLIEARAEGGKNLSGSATLGKYLDVPGFGGMDNTPSNTKLLKQRFLDLSKAAQNILNDRGVPPEAIAPSDNREKSFMKSFKDFLGLERERNKLNNLGFAQPIDDEGNVYDRDIYRNNVDSSDPYKLKEGGTLMAATGLMPLTNKTSNPTGNKPTKEKKIPQRGAKPDDSKVDPRDEALKLVAKNMKQKKTQAGIGAPTTPMTPPAPIAPVAGMPTPMTTALAAPDMPMPPEQPQMPIMAAKGKALEEGIKSKKKGKGLAVVIEMGSAEKPEYEEASMGTPSDPPPGATADEVKDNQHVLLSEGELVVPANVVRYHGLGMYEGMRREALQGLGEMEDAGQVEYIDNEVKTAAAGMTIMNAPNVATSQGIAKQQQQFTPGATPEAASARYVSTGFVDKNRDGVDDKMQKLSLPVPTSTVNTTPAGLRLGPTTDASTVVGAGNVGSYKDEQKNPGDDDGTTPPPKDDTPAPVAPAKVIQQPSGDDGGDPEINAGLGGARTTIGGVEYAVQYDFSGNIIGLANVADALTTGKANFTAPNPDVIGLIEQQTAGQKALGVGVVAPVANAFGLLEGNKEKIAAGKSATAALDSYRGQVGMRAQDMPMGRPSQAVIDAYAQEKINPNALAAPVDFEEQVGRDPNTPDGINYGMLGSPGTSGADFDEDEKEEIEGRNRDTLAAQRAGISDVPTQATMDRDKAFRDEVAAKNAKDALDAQMKGIGMGFAASTVAPGTATNAAISGKGYSSTGAAPAGSQYSSTGTFSTGSSADDTGVGSSGDLGGATGAGYGAGSDGVDTDDDDSTGASTGVGGSASGVDGMSGGSTSSSATAGTTPGTSYADDAQGSGGGPGGKIVCTEMYRQTQLDDWAQAMKTWHIYQKKYLTPIHEIGYHSLFKPFVRGMKVNKALTNLGAYLAKERTKHLRHILTKGKSADSIVGNVFCKIIHPIVYLVGLAVHKK